MILSTTDLRPGCTVDVTLAINGSPSCAKYHFNSAHRNSSFAKVKTQWRISCRDEVACYGHSLEKGYRQEDYYWGYVLRYGRCIQLGKTASGNVSKIAKFVCSENPRVWHGYPVDYIDDPSHDCPNREVLNRWREERVISKPEMIKLITGKGWKD